MKTLLLVLLCVACEAPKPKPADHWDALTSAECVAACKPLLVEHFTPHCSRLNGQGYYCPGDAYPVRQMDSVCECGRPISVPTPVPTNTTTVVHDSPKQAPAPDLITPVIVHHGLKFILGH